MRPIYYLTIVMGLCVACGRGAERKAEALLKRAELSIGQEQYSVAKLQIDSVRILYPKAFEARKKGIRLMQTVDLYEQQKTIAYLDSMMVEKQAALDSIRPHFVLEKDTAYQETGNYFYPTQTVEKNIGRSYLRAQVNEQGKMSLTSIYQSSRPIHHTSVRLSVGDEFAETPSSSDSYETSDLGMHIEKADYPIDQDGGATAFVLHHQDKNIQLLFQGDHSYRTYLNATDRKAIGEVFELAKILSAITQLQKEKQEAELKIKFVMRKMQETDPEQKKP